MIFFLLFQKAEKLSVKLSEDSSNTEAPGHLEEDLHHKEGIIEKYRVKAKQILYRIEQLENEHQEVSRLFVCFKV